MDLKNSVFPVFLVALLCVGIALLGCVQMQTQVSPTPTPQASVNPSIRPTSTPTPTPTAPGGEFPERDKNPLDITLTNGTSEIASVRFLTPTSFELIANISLGPCFTNAAYWNAGQEDLRIYFTRELNQTSCPAYMTPGAFKAVVDYSLVSMLRPLKSAKVYDAQIMIWEKNFEGMFCGGIAAFPCPRGFDCTLDGDYPDAGGKCVFNQSYYAGSRPA